MRRSLKPRLRNSLKTFSQHWRPPCVRSTGPALLSNHPRPCLTQEIRPCFLRALPPESEAAAHQEIRRDFKSVQLEQMPANLAHAHLTCIHADHMILKARQAPLIFGNERRLKRG